jgi:hypothetical protein
MEDIKRLFKIAACEETEFKKLNEFFDAVVVDSENDKQELTQITNKYNFDKNKNYLDIHEMFLGDRYIHTLSSQLLRDNKFDINPYNFLIKYCRIRGDSNVFEDEHGRHTDNWTELLAPVYTCIFYLRKDKTLRGGNVCIYGDTPLSRFKLKPVVIVESNAYNVLVFDGCLVHEVSNLHGFGIHDFIVIQFEKNIEKDYCFFKTYS